MTLQDYTTEELRAELKRRDVEARRERAKNRDNKAKYAYATGVVCWASRDPYCRREYRVNICEEDRDKYKLPNYELHKRCYPLLSVIKATDAPQVGDTVTIRARVTKARPDGFSSFHTPSIVEVIKRKEE